MIKTKGNNAESKTAVKWTWCFSWRTISRWNHRQEMERETGRERQRETERDRQTGRDWD